MSQKVSFFSKLNSSVNYLLFCLSQFSWHLSEVPLILTFSTYISLLMECLCLWTASLLFHAAQSQLERTCSNNSPESRLGIIHTRVLFRPSWSFSREERKSFQETDLQYLRIYRSDAKFNFPSFLKFINLC